MVRITPPASAGSMPNRSSASGSSAPARAAASRLMLIAAPMTSAISGSLNQTQAISATTSAQMTLLMAATASSFISNQRLLLDVS